jgi:predicted nucleotidyltransferase
MNIFDDYTLELLQALNEFEVTYLIVGGYAVNFHGYRRTTGDIDLWIKPDNDNKGRIISSFRKLGVKENILEHIDTFDFTKHLVFSDGEEPNKIDFLTYLSNVDFEEAWDKRIVSDMDGITIPFIDLKNLLLSKFVTGRAKDKVDIEELQKVMKLKKKD